MPSKELIEKVALAIMHDENTYRVGGEEYCETVARIAISTILAALQEPNANQEQAGMECIINGTRHSCPEIYVVPETPWHTWRAMLAASALGEQSDG